MTIVSETDASKNETYRDLILRAWLSALGDRRVIYLSGPITTGLRRIAAEENGTDSPTLEGVKLANSKDIREAAERLRRENPSDIIVEPASFTAEGWSQPDYLQLWKDLIERHAGEVCFLPNWQYSVGCAEEFDHAVALGVATSNLDRSALTLQFGIELLDRAVRDLCDRCKRTEGLGLLTQRLSLILERLKCRQGPQV
jgi:hypothetical protein